MQELEMKKEKMPDSHNEEEERSHSTMFGDDIDIDSSCSTPYVSAPSSPGRSQTQHCGFYYSAPASPMHFVLSTTTTLSSSTTESTCNSSFEFDFSASRMAVDSNVGAGSMTSADELFFNGQIRPMKLSTHLQRPQILAPLLDIDESEEEQGCRGRDLKFRDRSLRRRTRSMSPLRTQWHEDEEDFGESSNEKKKEKTNTDEGEEEEVKNELDEAIGGACNSGSSSRSSSVGRSSKRWVFLKEFLYRSKSEGRNNTHTNKFWGALSFSPVKDKKVGDVKKSAKSSVRKKPVNGNSASTGKRRVPPSPHELHYTANRAQAEEMRKKTFLPYRQGLLGCLGFSSKSYGAMNGLARALNPVSSR